MSINHIVKPTQDPKYDIYVRNVDMKDATIEEDLNVEGDIVVQGRVNGGQYKLIGQQELAVGATDINQGLFATNLTLRPSQTWVSFNSIEECKLTRDKLHFNPETSKFRKVFNFCFNFSVRVDYALRSPTDVSISLDFVCNGFPDFVPATPLNARINSLVYNQGHYQTSTTSGASGIIRCFQNNNVGIEGFTIVLLPPSTFLSTGTDVLACQVSCSIMDSEEIDL